MAGTSLAIEDMAARWLARRDSGDWSAHAQAALDRWLLENTAHRVAFLRLQAAWQESTRLHALGAGWQGAQPPPRGHWQTPPVARHEQMLQAVHPRTPQRQPNRRSWVARLAVAAALAACALFVRFNWPGPVSVPAIPYQTSVGEVRTIVLADGSRATLASNTRIEVRLLPQRRDIQLRRGEAIFAVAKDPLRPFSVEARGYHAVAVGTRFSVRRDDAALRVVVTEGTVRLDSPDAGQNSHPSALLPAGSVALVRADGVLVRSLTVEDAQQLLDWRNGLLVFRDTPLADAAAEFNRYNVRKLVLADAKVGELRIGGSFRWDNQDTFVRLLEAGFPLHAEATPTQIVLSSR